MRNSVLEVRLAGTAKPERAVEPFEVCLRTDPDRDVAHRVEPALDQDAAQTRATGCGRGDDPSERDLLVLGAGRHDPQVPLDRGRSGPGGLGPQVARSRIEPVRVEEHAGLLDDEHPLAERDNPIELAGCQFIERPIVPPQMHGPERSRCGREAAVPVTLPAIPGKAGEITADDRAWRRANFLAMNVRDDSTLCRFAAMQSVCVFLSSSPGRAVDVDAITALASELAARNLTLVYGGAHRGLMGVLADAVLAAGGRAVGVIPQALVEAEIAHRGLTELHVVDTMHQRKAMMFELADAFVVAPGGLGTLEEAFELLTGIQLGYHKKPVVFLDVAAFWPPLETFLDHAVGAGVMRREVRSLFRTASSATAALDALAMW